MYPNKNIPENGLVPAQDSDTPLPWPSLIVTPKQEPEVSETYTIPNTPLRPGGLYSRYNVTKKSGPTDPNAVYFVLRLDNGGGDPAHIEACRCAALEYAAKVAVCGEEFSHLEALASDLKVLVRRLDVPRFEYPPELRSPGIWGIAIDYGGYLFVFGAEPEQGGCYWVPSDDVCISGESLQALFPGIKLPTLADAGGDWTQAIWQNPDFDPDWKGE